MRTTRQKFNLILTLAALLTMAQTAWADDVTWYMDGGKNGHSTCTFSGNTAEVTSDQHSKTLRYTWTSGDGLSWRVNQVGNGLAKFDHPITNGCVVTFPDIIGTVTGMTITYLQFFNNAGCTMKMYVGKRGTTPTLLTNGGSDYLLAHSNSTAFNATFTGSIDVDADHPLAIWFDGEWDHSKDVTPFDWRFDELYAHIHKLQPGCLVGNNHHHHAIDGEDFQIFERDLPGENKAGLSKGQKVSENVPLEMCQTMNGMWGYKIADRDYKSVKDCVGLIIEAAGKNANLLLNIGPQPDGELPAAALQRLKGIGKWLAQYGETIYGTTASGMPKADWGTVSNQVCVRLSTAGFL